MVSETESKLETEREDVILRDYELVVVISPEVGDEEELEARIDGISRFIAIPLIPGRGRSAAASSTSCRSRGGFGRGFGCGFGRRSRLRLGRGIWRPRGIFANARDFEISKFHFGILPLLRSSLINLFFHVQSF